MPVTITETNLPHLAHRGKVRDIYDLGDALMIVATDRLSAFDVVLPDGIPEKGVVLNELSNFWFKQLADIIPSHFLAMGYDKAKVGKYYPNLDAEIARRAMLVKKAQPLPVECVVRGYLAGSAWSEYKKSGMICGAPGPKGLVESQRFEKPLFTPTTKATKGHDEDISFSEVERLVGKTLAAHLREAALALYNAGHAYAQTKGILVADTKFEFGILDHKLIVIDEVLTPDSSRFWAASDYAPGRPQDPFDKQYVRDWLNASGWNKTPPGPKLPQDVIDQTARRYKDAYLRITGHQLPRK